MSYQELVTVGVNGFLVKINAHRGEPLNEGDDSRTEHDREAHDSDDQNTEKYTSKILWGVPYGKPIFSWKRYRNTSEDQEPDKNPPERKNSS